MKKTTLFVILAGSTFFCKAQQDKIPNAPNVKNRSRFILPEGKKHQAATTFSASQTDTTGLKTGNPTNDAIITKPINNSSKNTQDKPVSVPENQTTNTNKKE